MGSFSSLGVYVPLALVCGAVLVTQPGFNSTLSNNVGGALNAATISLCVSAVSILIIRIFFAPGLSFSVALDKTPYWGWFGGFLGVFFVVSSMYVAPRIGATALVSLILCGQMVAALVYDRFGILGYGETPVTLTRALGILLIIAGTGLIVLRR